MKPGERVRITRCASESTCKAGGHGSHIGVIHHVIDLRGAGFFNFEHGVEGCAVEVPDSTVIDKIVWAVTVEPLSPEKELIGSVSGVCGGDPVILGTRITAGFLWHLHTRLGYTADRIKKEYPHLTDEQIAAALEYARIHPAVQTNEWDTEDCRHHCYTISRCNHDGTDMRHCVVCREAFSGPCEPNNYFHE